MSKYLTNQAIISQSKIEGTVASLEQPSQNLLFWRWLPPISWGQSAAYAVVTSISNPCRDFKGGVC